MRKWGIVVTVAYLLVLLGLVVPLAVSQFGGSSSIAEAYTSWWTWIPVGIAVFSQALLLFLSVDTSWRRLKPRAHVLVSCAFTAALLALLSVCVVLCIDAATRNHIADAPYLFGGLGVLWVFWAILFYLYARNSSDVITRATSWLLKGSVLELLIAVPSHIIVRRRHDCSAPVVTSFGIATGIAIMLLSFGPSVLMLYKKRMDEYANRGPAAK
jgi:hypothetical protein